MYTCPNCDARMTVNYWRHRLACDKTPPPAELRKLFLNEHITLNALGARYGVSSDFIRKQLSRAGIDPKRIDERRSEIARQLATEQDRSGAARPWSSKVYDPRPQCAACEIRVNVTDVQIVERRPGTMVSHWHRLPAAFCPGCMADGYDWQCPKCHRWTKFEPIQNGNGSAVYVHTRRVRFNPGKTFVPADFCSVGGIDEQ